MSYGMFPMVQIDRERRYWLVRTSGGLNYDTFYHENFIGIGWSTETPLEDIADGQLTVDFVRRYYPNHARPGLISNQIDRFMNEMKIGDVVLIPSESSMYISFGIIESEPLLPETVDNWFNLNDFLRIRKVRWIKTVQRDRLDTELYRLFYSHHTISDATEAYGDIIDRTLHSFYVKGDKAHLVVNIRQTRAITAVDVVDFVSSTLELIPILNEAADTRFERRDVQLKVDVQSPGIAEFIGASTLVFGLGIILVFVVGGKFKGQFSKTPTEQKVSVEATSEGLIEKILKIVKHKDEAELKKIQTQLNTTVKNLDVRLPKELEDVESTPE